MSNRQLARDMQTEFQARVRPSPAQRNQHFVSIAIEATTQISESFYSNAN